MTGVQRVPEHGQPVRGQVAPNISPLVRNGSSDLHRVPLCQVLATPLQEMGPRRVACSRAGLRHAALASHMLYDLRVDGPGGGGVHAASLPLLPVHGWGLPVSHCPPFPTRLQHLCPSASSLPLGCLHSPATPPSIPTARAGWEGRRLTRPLFPWSGLEGQN